MSVQAFVRSLWRGTGRTLRLGGLGALFSTSLTALCVFSLAVYATVLVNVQRLSSSFGTHVAAVAFLTSDDAAAAAEVRARMALLPGVLEARLVAPEEALRRARAGLGASDAALRATSGVHMPWVVEIVPRVDQSAAVVSALGAIDGVDEVMTPSEEVRHLDSLLRVVGGVGVAFGAFMALVVVLVVSNAVRLTVFARQDEIAILRLVGATHLFVRAPFVVAGFVQGGVGAVVGIVAFFAFDTSVARVLDALLSGWSQLIDTQPLPLWAFAALLGAAASLGALGAYLAARRASRA